MDLNVIECNFIASLSYCLDITPTDRPHVFAEHLHMEIMEACFRHQKKKKVIAIFYLVFYFFLCQNCET